MQLGPLGRGERGDFRTAGRAGTTLIRPREPPFPGVVANSIAGFSERLSGCRAWFS